MQALLDIQRATIAARKRTGDTAIATRVQAGRLQVGRATYPAGKSVAEFAPLTGWLPIMEALRAIDAL